MQLLELLVSHIIVKFISHQLYQDRSKDLFLLIEHLDGKQELQQQNLILDQELVGYLSSRSNYHAVITVFKSLILKVTKYFENGKLFVQFFVATSIGSLAKFSLNIFEL